MIPLKIETLLAGRVVEQNRVEYKEGWNPGNIPVLQPDSSTLYSENGSCGLSE